MLQTTKNTYVFKNILNQLFLNHSYDIWPFKVGAILHNVNFDLYVPFQQLARKFWKCWPRNEYNKFITIQTTIKKELTTKTNTCYISFIAIQQNSLCSSVQYPVKKIYFKVILVIHSQGHAGKYPGCDSPCAVWSSVTPHRRSLLSATVQNLYHLVAASSSRQDKYVSDICHVQLSCLNY